MIQAILLLQLAAAPPPAPSAEAAARLVHASINDYELGFFDKALHEAEQAYHLDPLPQILFNIGQCHRGLQHWEKAAYYYQHYLERLPSAPNRATVEDLLTEVTYRLKAEQLPAPPGQPASTAVAVVPTPAPTAAAVVPSDAPAPATADTAPAAAVEAPPEQPHSHTAGWILGSVAVACLAVAVVGIVEVESYEAFRGQLAAPASYTQWETDSANAAGQGQQASAFEVVAIAAGAVALATGTAAVLTW